MPTNGTQAVARAAALVDLVVQTDAPMSFTKLSEEVGLSRSTTSRLLAALERAELVEREESGAFVPGRLFSLYASRHDPWTELVRLARPVLEQLAARTGETVNLGVPSGDTVAQVAQIDTQFVLGSRNWVGVDVPAHCSALGKVLYAFDVLRLPAGALARPTKKSVGSATRLRAELAEVRERGFAQAIDELEVGLTAVAAPVHGPNGTVVAALGVSGPGARLTAQIDQVGRLLIEQADALTRLLSRRVLKEGAA